MVKIKIVVVGKTKAPFLTDGESFYLERLRRYASTEWIEVKPVTIKKGKTREAVLASEGERIKKRLHQRDHIIALDIRGKTYTSQSLARRIETLVSTQDRLCFIIGGALGLSRELLNKTADENLSLSTLTLTHEMSRMILLEQVYRAFTILRGEKYHK
ncbi:MAG: 23S rRNA (pseudouridine(1915)-N(3))-methyltransferase RlmH [Desulfatiglandaceae bacterium]